MAKRGKKQTAPREPVDRGARALRRQASDAALLQQARDGDADAYTRLCEHWIDHAYDRARSRGAGEDEALAAVQASFDAVGRHLSGKTKGANGDRDAGDDFAVDVLRGVRTDTRDATPAVSDVTLSRRSAERLSRGTDEVAMANDEAIASVVRDAVVVLGADTSAVIDLHWRHELTEAEVAAVTGLDAAAVHRIVEKAPAGVTAALRTRMLWKGGTPDHDELASELQAAKVTTFGPEATRIINRHVKACAVCRSRSLVALPAIDVFAAIPVAKPPATRRGGIVTAATGALAATAAAAVVEGTEAAGAAETGETAASNEATATTEPEAGAAPAATDADAPAADSVDEAAKDEPSATAGDVVAAAIGGVTGESEPGESEPTAEPSNAADDAPTEPTLAVPDAGEPEATSSDRAATDATEAMPLAALSSAAAAKDAGATKSMGSSEGVGKKPPSTTTVTDDGDAGSRKGWLIASGVAAVVIVLVLILIFTRSSGDSSTDVAAETPTTKASTTTTTRSSTSSSTTTTAPSTSVTEASTTTTAAPGPTPPPVVSSTTTLPLDLKIDVSIKPASAQEGYAPGTVRLSWSVTAQRPVDVRVHGPGFESAATSGDEAICPYDNGAPACSPPSGPYYYYVTVTENGQLVRETTATLRITSR